jgi:ABC-2 type transport system permease protein
MLWYKTWRESEARFLLSACTIACLCVGFVLFHRQGANVADRSKTYIEYIWRIVYKGYLRELFVLLALLLGVGGLRRERDHGTAGFTLTLPLSRFRLISSRAVVGLLEVALLSLLPVLVIPALSSFVGQVYPWSQALRFSLLWMVGGAFLFAMGFLASILFAGEYTAAVVAVIVMLCYSVVADLPFLEHYVIDVHDLMSGAGMYYFQPGIYLLVGPLPWMALSEIVLVVCGSVALAGRITQKQDF